jgi:hypothetical protein
MESVDGADGRVAEPSAQPMWANSYLDQLTWATVRSVGPILPTMFHVKHFCPIRAQNLTRPKQPLPL